MQPKTALLLASNRFWLRYLGIKISKKGDLMKVLLICPMLENNVEPPAAPLGLLSIATHLQNNNHEVKIDDRSFKAGNIKKRLLEFKPDIIGLSVFSSKSIKDALNVSRTAKELSITVVWGGTLPSAIPDIVLKEDCVDIVCIGEGEFTWAELLQVLENNKPLDTINGIAFKDDGLYIKTADRKFSDPNEWPIINWSFVDVSKYLCSYNDCQRMMWVYSAKGCPGSCTFCYNKHFHKCAYRKRPIEHVFSEINDLVTNYNADGVYFADEVWCLSRAEMKEKCDKIKATGLDFVWGCQLKVGILDLEDYEYMYQSGCRWIFFGIESGSPERLKKIKKGISLDDVEQTMKYCSQANIAAWTSFMLGFPDETEEELKQTVSLIKTLSPYAIFTCFFFTPTLGSDIYEKLIEEGKLPSVESLSTLNKYSWDVVGKNFSKVPTRDLKVVNAFVLWWSFTSANNSRGKSKYGSAIRVISHILANLRKSGIKHLFAMNCQVKCATSCRNT